MNNIKAYLAILLAASCFTVCSSQEKKGGVLQDFAALAGNWEGSLTYLDYTTGKPYTMPANVAIKRIGQTNRFSFSNSYPKEQSANTTDTLTISGDGRYIDTELVKERNVLTNGDIEIVTEEKGKDGNDNKSALFRHTYTVGKTQFTRRKEVQFEGEPNWIKRHEYTYQRKSGQ